MWLLQTVSVVDQLRYKWPHVRCFVLSIGLWHVSMTTCSNPRELSRLHLRITSMLLHMESCPNPAVPTSQPSLASLCT
jgi:hypothetical protein